MIRLNIIKNGCGGSVPLLVKKSDDFDNVIKKIHATSKNKLKIKKPAKMFLIDSSEFSKEFWTNDSEKNGLTICVARNPDEKFSSEGLSKKIVKTDPSNVTGTIKIVGPHLSTTEAQKALNILARNKDVISVLALPDLSLSMPCPVGTSVMVRNRIYPSWIGTDIGCGISMFELSSSIKNINNTYTKVVKNYQDKWISKDSKESCIDAKKFRSNLKVPKGLESIIDNHDQNLGSIGAGNHFCEIQEIVQYSQELSDKYSLNLSEKTHYLCVHSGSRSLGLNIQQIFAKHSVDADGNPNLDSKKRQKESLVPSDPDFNRFVEYQNYGIEWANLNRLAIAKRFTEIINKDSKMIVNLCHNFLEQDPENKDIWIHRKGSIPSNKGPALIPGSRGTHSYLVSGDSSDLHSLPHGAGRRFSRTDAEKRFSSKNPHNAPQYVVCRDKKLMAQEAPDAYKDIDDIMEHLSANYGVKVIAIFKPLLTYKV